MPREQKIVARVIVQMMGAPKKHIEDTLKMYSLGDESLKRVIIVGAGQTGTALSKALDIKKVNTKIIEKNKEKCDSLSQNLQKVIVINGDGTDEALLKEENIGDVDFVIAVTDDEQSNVFISLLAKRLGARKTVTRINRLSYIHLVSAIGIDSVVSSRLSAIRSILQEIRRGKIISVTPLKGEHAEAIEAEALETSDIVNSPLSEVKFPKGAIIVSIVACRGTFCMQEKWTACTIVSCSLLRNQTQKSSLRDA